jgi:DNA-binding NarL/FixJ family response regulator
LSKILIVDDSPVIRRSVRACIERNTGWEVCGEAGNGAIAVKMVRQLSPDVIILDLSMPVMNGLEAAKQIASIAPEAAILMYTLHNCGDLLKEARAAGIRGVFSKSEDLGDKLIASIRALLNGPSSSTAI